jgi:hypothetical protein
MASDIPSIRPMRLARPAPTLKIAMSYQLIASKSLALLPRLLSRSTSYTPEEVRLRLGDERADDPRTLAVQAIAAQTGVWSGRLARQQAYELGRAAGRLPSVVFWYCQGVSLEEIGQRLSPMGGPWDAERALNVATVLIAETLNRRTRTDLAA